MIEVLHSSNKVSTANLPGRALLLHMCFAVILTVIPAGAEEKAPEKEREETSAGFGINKLTMSNSVINAYDVFEQLDRLAVEKKWQTYFKTFRDALSLHGEKLYQVSETYYENFGTALRRRVHALPREAFDVFREYYDTSAKNEFAAWKRSGDMRILIRIVENYFPSSFTDDALDLLGSYDFEAGRYRRAASWYKLLLEHYPDPELSKKETLLRTSIAYVAGGEPKKILELLKYAKDHGLDSKEIKLDASEEKQTIGKLLWSLTDAAVQRRAERSGLEDDEVGWPTYRGNQQRNALVTQDRVPGRVVGFYQVRDYDSPADTTIRGYPYGFRPNTPPETYTFCYPFFPVVGKGRVFIPGQYDIGSIKLDTGKRLRSYTSRRGGYMQSRKRENNRHFIYTAHLEPDIIYSALATRTDGGTSYRGIEIRGLIFLRDMFAFDMIGRVRWSSILFTSMPQNERFSVPGTPVKVGNNLISPLYDNAEWTIAGLAAFNERTGRSTWVREVCYNKQELTMFGSQTREPLASPLAEHDGIVYFLTNLGALTAVDGETGRILWVSAYDELQIEAADGYEKKERALFWQNSSPIVTDDAIIFTPLDSRFCYAFELETGKQRWKIPADYLGREFNRLVGVSSDCIILSGNAVTAIDIRTGKAAWKTELRKEHTAIALGCISKKYAYIPNRLGFNVYDLIDGKLVHEHYFKTSRSMNMAGNIIIVGDYFITASKTHVTVFRGVSLEERLSTTRRQAAGGENK